MPPPRRLFDRTRGRGVQSPHTWAKYWEIMMDARDIFGPKKFGAHIIVGMGETEHEVMQVVQQLVDLGGHSHMFCFFPEKGSLMDHLPATPRDQWRRVQLARYLVDYCGVRVDQMRFDEAGRIVDFGMPQSELSVIIDAGIAFRTSGCPGKFADDISACDRPYGDSPPSNIASYPFPLKPVDLRKVRQPVEHGKAGRNAMCPAKNSTFCRGNTMTRPFRVIDTGVRPCRAQMAFDQALIEGHRAGTTPDTIRFLTFPPSVLVGRHQAISQELNLPACHAAGVGIGRRVTGGGALYLDEGQFGWEIVASRSALGLTDLGQVARAFCEAAADGLSRLGIAARYRPRNDIEVDGRKISGTGGFFDGDTIFYQGTVLVDMDGARMASLLNIPAAKLPAAWSDQRRATGGDAERAVQRRAAPGGGGERGDVGRLRGTSRHRPDMGGN